MFKILIKAPQAKSFKPFNNHLFYTRQEAKETVLFWIAWERRTNYKYRIVKG